DRRALARRLVGAGARAVPGDVAAHAVLDASRWPPAELAGRARAADHRATEIARAAVDVDDRDVADDSPHGLGDLTDGDILVADQVVGAVGGDRAERADDAVGEVLDIDEAARLAAVAGDSQRLAAQSLGDERGDDRRFARAGTVRDAEAQDRALHAVELGVGAAVQLTGKLRRRVEVGRRTQRGVLVDAVGAGLGVHPDRR